MTGRGSAKEIPAAIKLSALVLWSVPLLARTMADSDLWGHVIFGRDIVAGRSLPSVDPYSFTSDRPWINHEWLAEVLMYLAYALAGAVGLVYLKTVVVFLVVVCVTAAWRHRKLRALHEVLLIALVLLGMFPRFITVRPQVFSLLCFALELLLLNAAERGHLRKLAWMPFIFAFWANAHGGFLVGLGVLGLWTAAKVLRAAGRAPGPVVVFFASLAATLANPYGTGLWRFLWETVGTSRPDIADWTPAASAGAPLLVAWVLLVITAAYAVWTRRQTGIPFHSVAIVAALAIGTLLRVGRLDAFLALAVVMLLGPLLGRPRDDHDAGGSAGRDVIPRGVILLLIVLGAALTALSPCLDMRTGDYPEPEAVAFLEGRSGRLLTPFNWGEYAIWHLAPDLKVSMDGRRETVYSEASFSLHHRLLRGEPGAASLVSGLAPDFVWLPVGSPAVALLEREGWHTAFRGPASVVLARHVGAPVVVVEQGHSGPRCFPQR